MAVTILVSMALVGADVIQDPTKFLATVFESTKDVRFDFEGTQRQFLPSRKHWHDENEFSGSFIYRSGFSIKSESINNRLAIDENERTTLRRNCIMDKGKVISYLLNRDGIESVDFPDLDSAVDKMTRIYPSGLDIFLVPYLLTIASNPKRSFIHEGVEKVSDHECDIISSGYTRSSDGKQVINYRFWLDMNRGGHPLRFDMLDQSGETKYRIDEIALMEFPAGNSKRLWLPVSSRHQYFITSTDLKEETAHPIYKKGDVYRTSTNRVLNGTVRINGGIDDGVFVLKRRNGERITEKTAKLSVKAAISKAERGLSVKESQAVLDEKLKAGEQRREQIIATSVARNGHESPTRWLPLALGVVGISGLAGFIYLKAKGH